jgi:hypothetical protein
MQASFQLAPGEYWVFVCAKGKKNVDAPQIDGWLQAKDVLGDMWYYLNLGSVTVGRKWTDATDLFYIDAEEAGPLPFDPTQGGDQWVFNYMTWLDALTLWNELPVDYDSLAYFWQLQNNGSQVIKVRFYKKP